MREFLKKLCFFALVSSFLFITQTDAVEFRCRNYLKLLEGDAILIAQNKAVMTNEEAALTIRNIFGPDAMTLSGFDARSRNDSTQVSSSLGYAPYMDNHGVSLNTWNDNDVHPGLFLTPGRIDNLSQFQIRNSEGIRVVHFGNSPRRLELIITRTKEELAFDNSTSEARRLLIERYPEWGLPMQITIQELETRKGFLLPGFSRTRWATHGVILDGIVRNSVSFHTVESAIANAQPKRSFAGK